MKIIHKKFHIFKSIIEEVEKWPKKTITFLKTSKKAKFEEKKHIEPCKSVHTKFHRAI